LQTSSSSATRQSPRLNRFRPRLTTRYRYFRNQSDSTGAVSSCRTTSTIHFGPCTSHSSPSQRFAGQVQQPAVLQTTESPLRSHSGDQPHSDLLDAVFRLFRDGVDGRLDQEWLANTVKSTEPPHRSGPPNRATTAAGCSSASWRRRERGDPRAGSAGRPASCPAVFRGHQPG
jgi:hypothetical protein